MSEESKQVIVRFGDGAAAILQVRDFHIQPSGVLWLAFEDRSEYYSQMAWRSVITANMEEE